MDGDDRPPIKVRLHHLTDRRARLRLEKPLDATGVGALADRLAALPRVVRVVARPNTGSIIIEARASAGELSEILRNAAAIRMVPPTHPPPVGQMIQFSSIVLDRRIRERTEGALDLRSAMGVLLLALAIAQAVRGQLLGPTSTLALAAFHLMEESKPSGSR